MTESVLIAALMSSIGVLAAVIGNMYLQQRADYAETKGQLHDCVEDREKLWMVIADMKRTTPEKVKEEYSDKSNGVDDVQQ